MELLPMPILRPKISKIRQIIVYCIALLLYSSALLPFLQVPSSYRDVHTPMAVRNKGFTMLLQQGVVQKRSNESTDIERRRNLSGPGSSPPRCISKCAKCTPCKAVRVPVKPGAPRIEPEEYYPEAWRCKCRNKLYMP